MLHSLVFDCAHSRHLHSSSSLSNQNLIDYFYWDYFAKDVHSGSAEENIASYLSQKIKGNGLLMQLRLILDRLLVFQLKSHEKGISKQISKGGNIMFSKKERGPAAPLSPAVAGIPGAYVAEIFTETAF